MFTKYKCNLCKEEYPSYSFKNFLINIQENRNPLSLKNYHSNGCLHVINDEPVIDWFQSNQYKSYLRGIVCKKCNLKFENNDIQLPKDWQLKVRTKLLECY